jgi:hypothetical protein
MCNMQVSASSVAETSRGTKDVPRKTGVIWEVDTFAQFSHCTSVLLGRFGISLAGVMGSGSVPDDWEVERDTEVEANGVVAREDKTLVCL